MRPDRRAENADKKKQEKTDSRTALRGHIEETLKIGQVAGLLGAAFIIGGARYAACFRSLTQFLQGYGLLPDFMIGDLEAV